MDEYHTTAELCYWKSIGEQHRKANQAWREWAALLITSLGLDPLCYTKEPDVVARTIIGECAYSALELMKRNKRQERWIQKLRTKRALAVYELANTRMKLLGANRNEEE